jgi:RNA polymerase sigma-70 factor, ECF subfamily
MARFVSLSTSAAERALALGASETEAEDELVAGLRAGDSRAVARLFDLYAVPVRRILARVLGVDAELPDLIQDVFVAALTGIRSYRGSGRELRAWLTRIAVFRARVWLRRQARRRRVAPVIEHYVASTTPGRDPEIGEALRRSYDVLALMPEEERVAFALRFVDGMELTEVASVMDLSLATVKRRLQRARARFEELARKDAVLCGMLGAAR